MENEIMVKATELESRPLAQELVEKRERHISSYASAVKNIEGSAWHLARTIYSAIHDADFGEMFGTIEAYAHEVGTSRTNVSKLEKVYARKLLLGQRDGEGEQYSTSQLMEFGSIELEETNVFVEKMSVTPADTVRVIRKKAKTYKELGNEEQVEGVEAEDTGAEETEAEESENVATMIIEYNGEKTQILDAETIKKILDIMNGGIN